MNLHRLLQGVNLLSSIGELDKEITGIASDSRAVKPGYAFVCYEGVNVDGHTFIPHALQNGATAIVGEKPESMPPDVTYIQTPNGRIAFLAHRSKLVRESGGSSEIDWHHRHKRQDLNSPFSAFDFQRCGTEFGVDGHGWNPLRRCLCRANDYDT